MAEVPRALRSDSRRERDSYPWPWYQTPWRCRASAPSPALLMPMADTTGRRQRASLARSALLPWRRWSATAASSGGCTARRFLPLPTRLS
eukprot:753461-Hanusia_phi.AAC.7